MPQTININNFGTANLVEQTRLASNADSAQATIVAESTQNIAANNFVLIGQRGIEQSELKRVSSVTDTATLVLTTNLAYDHSRYEDLVVLYGDKIKVYRAANVDGTQPADGSFSVLGSGTIDIDPDQTYTSFTDSSGGSDYWYKFTYHNSVAVTETPLADSAAVRGGTAGVYCTIYAIRQRAGLTTNRYITDSDIDDYRRAAQDEVNGALHGLYTLPFSAPIPAIIQEITARLAAGLLLTSPFGSQYVNTTSEGKDKLKDARADLMALQNKTSAIVVDGESLAIANVGGFRMYPDATTASSDFTEGGARFKVEDRY